MPAQPYRELLEGRQEKNLKKINQLTFNSIPTKNSNNQQIIPEIEVKLLYFVRNITVLQKFFYFINCY